MVKSGYFNSFNNQDIDISFSPLTNVRDLTYVVSDTNVANQDISVTVKDTWSPLFILQIIIVICILMIGIFVFNFVKNLRLEKRISPFTIEPKLVQKKSFSDGMFEFYHDITSKIEKLINKSAFAKKYSAYLNKYIPVSGINHTGEQILAGKVFISIAFMLIAVVAKIIQFELISVYELVFPALIGFFILDGIYFVKYRLYRSRIENDLLSAIIVMNNAFKSGRSIIQAIDIVSKEIEGDIGKEFQKMNLELSYGLDIETIFKRFAERIQIEEVSYLTASLTILNKTGGNIIEVFSSIEKNLFNKKKLRLELKSLTSSSKFIVYILFAVPFLFVLFISIINQDYFIPFITSTLGMILLGFMVVYYIIFVVVVRKVMKVVI